MQRVGRVLRHPHALNCGKWVFISAGASVPGVIWNTICTPSIVTFSPVCLISRVGRISAGGAGRGGLAEAAVDAALRVARQHRAVHVDRAAAHGVAGDHVLADRVLGEVLGRDDLHLAGLDVGFVDDAAHAAVVVDVRVAVDDRDDRPLAEVLGHEIVGRLRRLGRDQRIEHDPAGVALDEGDVGEVVAAHLVDAVVHLEQAVLHVELGVAPQARVHRVGRGLVEADVGLVGLEVPDHVALRVLDGQRVGLADQAARGVLEVLASLKFRYCCTARLAALVASVAGLGWLTPGCCVKPTRATSSRPP